MKPKKASRRGPQKKPRPGPKTNAQKRTYDDLDHLAGTWVEDPEFDAAIAAQDVIDESRWK